MGSYNSESEVQIGGFPRVARIEMLLLYVNTTDDLYAVSKHSR